jgi:hypothetical protein
MCKKARRWRAFVYPGVARFEIHKRYRRRFMAACPICNSEAEALDRTGDAEGFDCPSAWQI